MGGYQKILFYSLFGEAKKKEGKGKRIANTILKKNKVVGLTLLDFKT